MGTESDGGGKEVGRGQRSEVRGQRSEDRGQRSGEKETDKAFKAPSLMDITTPDNRKD